MKDRDKLEVARERELSKKPSKRNRDKLRTLASALAEANAVIASHADDVNEQIPKDVKKRINQLFGKRPNPDLKSGMEQARDWWNKRTLRVANSVEYFRKYADSREADVLWKNLPRVHDLTMGYESPSTPLEQETVTMLRGAMAPGGVNIPKVWARYDRHLKNMDQRWIDLFNKSAGIRLNSQTDFRPWHIIELSQMLADLRLKGGMGHVYTRQPEMLDIFGNTGLKFNMSVSYAHHIDGRIMKDRQGTLYDQIAMDRNKAQAYRRKYRNAGTMLVALNDHDLETGLNDRGIDMIIPYHAGKVPASVGAFRDAKDYTDLNKEDWSGFRATKKKRIEVSPDLWKTVRYMTVNGPDGRPVDIYEGQQLTREHHGDDRKRYLSLCAKLGIKPRFYDVLLSNGRSVTKHDNYMKLVRDVARSGSPQQVVDPTKINWEAARPYVERWVKRGGHQRDVAVNPALHGELRRMINLGALKWMKATRKVPSVMVQTKEELAAGRGVRDVHAVPLEVVGEAFAV
jgi:uncharacterized protein YifE (UPF0438 family)